MKNDEKPRSHKEEVEPFNRVKCKHFLQKLNNLQAKMPRKLRNVEGRMEIENSPFSGTIVINVQARIVLDATISGPRCICRFLK